MRARCSPRSRSDAAAATRSSSSRRPTTRNLMVVAADNDRTQGTRYLYDRATDKLAKLFDLAPWLVPRSSPRCGRGGICARWPDDPRLPDAPARRRARKTCRPSPVRTAARGRGILAGLIPSAVLANRGLRSSSRTTGDRRATGGSARPASASGPRDGRRFRRRQMTCRQRGSPIRGAWASMAAATAGMRRSRGIAFSPELYACGASTSASQISSLIDSIPPYWEPERRRCTPWWENPEKERRVR